MLRILRFLRWLLPRVSLSLLVLVLLLYVGEEYIKHYYIYSHAINGTLMNRRWQEKYLGEGNSLGYRDFEWTPANLANKTLILLTGDSFADGQGINDRKDRMGDVLGEALGDDYAVMLVAKSGWHTGAMLLGLHNYPYSGNALVMTYYINDIADACIPVLRREIAPTSSAEPKGFVHDLVYSSHLADFVYWNVYARIKLRNTLNHWDDNLKDCFADETVWNYHEAELRSIYNLARLRQIPLVVVILPEMLDIDLFADELAQVKAFFAERNVIVVDLSDKWRTYDVGDRIASPFDNHGSALIYHDIGETLASIKEIRQPTPQPYEPTIETLLSPQAYQAYEDYIENFDLVAPDDIIFMPATNENQSLELSTYFVNTTVYYPLATEADHQKAFDFLAMWEKMSTESELKLTPEEQLVLQDWRQTKNADDLVRLGISYLFISSFWESWLTQSESDALFESGDYEIVQEWNTANPNIYYRLLRVAE